MLHKGDEVALTHPRSHLNMPQPGVDVEDTEQHRRYSSPASAYAPSTRSAASWPTLLERSALATHRHTAHHFRPDRQHCCGKPSLLDRFLGNRLAGDRQPVTPLATQAPQSAPHHRTPNPVATCSAVRNYLSIALVQHVARYWRSTCQESASASGRSPSPALA